MNQSLETYIEGKKLLNCLVETYGLYMKHGARSSKKVNCFHEYIKTQIESIFPYSNGYKVNLEKDIISLNSSNKKKCDVVLYKHDKPYIIFPIKIIMSNYKQNKNNNWENLTGELTHLKWRNNDIHIVPINIYMGTTPYLQTNKLIKTFEKITYKDISQYEYLKTKNLAYDVINYIIDVNHNCKVGEKFDKIPTITGFNHLTKYRSFNDILQSLV